MENFLSYISEATLSIPELEKRSGRIETLADFINNQKPIETEVGERIISWINPQYKVAFENGDLKSAFPRGTAVFNTDKNEKLRINQIIKSDAFGGGGSGSGGGSSGTKDAESAQCVYLQAIWDNPNTKFTKDELAVAYDKVYVNATKDGILNLSDDWVTSSITSAKILYKALNKKRYTFHRGSDWVKTLEKLFNNSGQDYFSDINKWTPADIWLINNSELGKYDLESGVGLPYLNNVLRQAYANRDIIGVSLKKTTRARLNQVNYRKPFKEPTFT